jgi:hypothetical protein
MKTKNRVRQNGSAKSAAQQGKTRTSKAGDDAKKIALIVFDVKGKRNGGAYDDIGQIEFSTAEWAPILKDASARGEKISDWLQRVVKNGTAQSPRNCSVGLTPKQARILELLAECRKFSVADWCVFRRRSDRVPT